MLDVPSMEGLGVIVVTHPASWRLAWPRQPYAWPLWQTLRTSLGPTGATLWPWPMPACSAGGCTCSRFRYTPWRTSVASRTGATELKGSQYGRSCRSLYERWARRYRVEGRLSCPRLVTSAARLEPVAWQSGPEAPA